MSYFKHAELVNRYHVSLKTVHNWIDAAKQGKLDLKLQEHAGRTYVADTPSNIVTLKKLADHGKKYRNSRFQMTSTPAPAFYEAFSRKQILDIITSLNVHREIPRQYNYIGESAESWDAYIQNQAREHIPGQLSGTLELFRTNLASIESLLGERKRVNIIDIGPGNGFPVRELLEHLVEMGVLHRYIAIDISTEMLHIAESNIKEWFGDKVIFEGHVRDITYERFDDILVDDMLGKEADKTINLVLLLGGTLMNFATPSDALRVVHGSMGREDLLFYTAMPDSEAARRYFNLGAEKGNARALSPLHTHLFDLLNIDPSAYDVEIGFDEQEHMRYIRVRLKKALTLKFKFENGERHVDIGKGETILLWRAWHFSVLNTIAYFENSGFKLVQSNLTKDRQFLLTISGVDTASDGEAS